MPSIYALKQIETPRLLIRSVQLGDEYPLNKAINNSLKFLQKWQAWAKDPSIEATRDFIQRGVFAWESGSVVDFPMVVIHKEDNKIIAASGYNNRSDITQGLYEIGYWCDVDYQGKGYVTEYVNALTRYAFDRLGAAKVVISMQVENEKSIAVAKRLNFTNEGVKDPDPMDCVADQVEENYIYAVNNADDLPDLKYSWTDVDIDLSVQKIISWAKNTLKITDNKAFARSKVIVKTPWSNVLEINTGNEIFYLKQTPAMFSLEPKIIHFFKEELNAHVPEIIGENSALHCFLMRCSGKNLREVLKHEFEESLVIRAVKQFSATQIKGSEHVHVLLDMGVPDYTLDQLPYLYNHLIKQKELLIDEDLTDAEISKLEKLSDTVVELCHKLSSYNIKQTIVQPDFNDNNTLVDDSRQKITIIDLGEIIISHPFYSLLNFLWQMKKHHGLTEEDDLYQRLKDACFDKYRHCFDNDNDFNDALKIAEIANILCGLVYQDRFMKACGKENLKQYNHWKLGDLLRNFMSQVQLHAKLFR